MSDREWTAQRIREFRAELGMTQNAFAKLARVHLGTLIRWETDKFKPSLMASARLNEIYEKHKRK